MFNYFSFYITLNIKRNVNSWTGYHKFHQVTTWNKDSGIEIWLLLSFVKCTSIFYESWKLLVLKHSHTVNRNVLLGGLQLPAEKWPSQKKHDQRRSTMYAQELKKKALYEFKMLCFFYLFIY